MAGDCQFWHAAGWYPREFATFVEGVMSRRPWVIPPVALVTIFLGLVVYNVVMEVMGWDPLGVKGEEHPEFARLIVWSLSWMVVCLVVGWIRYARGKRPRREAAAWPLAVVPLALALCTSAYMGWHDYTQVAGGMGRAGNAAFRFDPGILILNSAIHLLVGAFFSSLLLVHAAIWRLPVTPGRCGACNYDLTGNATGVCPECGERVVVDQNIPRRYYRRRSWWAPELGRLPDAKARYEAAQAAAKAGNGDMVAGIAVWVVVGWGLRLCLGPPKDLSLGVVRWPAAAALAVWMIGFVWVVRQAHRRTLRRVLRWRLEEEERASKGS